VARTVERGRGGLAVRGVRVHRGERADHAHRGRAQFCSWSACKMNKTSKGVGEDGIRLVAGLATFHIIERKFSV